MELVLLWEGWISLFGWGTLCTQGTLLGGRVKDHRMMFTKHLHLQQSYIQAILYIYKTDYMIDNCNSFPCKVAGRIWC